MSQELYELPEGWEWTDVVELAFVKGGKRLPKGKKLLDSPTKHPYIRVADFTDTGGINTKGLKYITDDIYETIKRYTITHRDLYISIAGTIGKTGVIPSELDGANLTENAAKLVFKNNQRQDLFFIYYFTLSSNFVAQSGIATKTVAQPKLALTRLGKMKIPLPPLNEQKRIVAKLDALFTRIDTAITHLQQTLELSKALFASETSIAFEKISTKHGTASLSQLVQINSGIALPKIFKDWKASGSISFYKVAQMNNDGRIMKDAAITFDSNIALTHRIKLFPKGSVLIPKRGGAILTDKKRLLLEDASYDSNIMGLKADEKNITDEYLFRFLLSINLGDYIDTAVIPQINNKHIAQMKIPLAPIEEQKRIVGHLDALSERTHTLEVTTQEKINDLTALKASLLDSAFKGEL